MNNGQLWQTQNPLNSSVFNLEMILGKAGLDTATNRMLSSHLGGGVSCL